MNKVVKDHLHSQFQAWYVQEICHQLQKHEERKPVDLRINVIKPLSSRWVVSTCEYIKGKPEIIKNGFKEAGIIL